MRPSHGEIRHKLNIDALTLWEERMRPPHMSLSMILYKFLG